MMKRVLLGGLALLLSTSLPAFAGKNGGGSLIVHTNDAFSYTSSVCALFAGQEPASCEAANTRSDKDTSTPAHIWIIAAFDPTATPGVAVVYFGLDHNLPTAQGYFENFSFCGPAGTIEVPDAGWPDTGGNSVAFGAPVTGDNLFAVYYVNAYKADATSFVGTGINPTGGYAAFIDDSNPPFQDDITNFGVVRWGQAGSNECPTAPLQGACCMQEDATCVLMYEGDCASALGVFQGDGSTCDSPCGPCCYWAEQDQQWFRRCVITTEADCTTGPWNAHAEVTACGPIDADFGKPGKICTTDPEQAGERWYCQDPRIDCETATQPTSWGQLKSLYR